MSQENNRLEDRQKIRVNKDKLFPFLAGAALLGSGILVYLVYRSYAWSIFLAFLLYVGFEGINDKLRKAFYKIRGGRDIAAILSSFFVIITTVGPAFFIIRLLVQESIQLFYQIKELISGEGIFELIYKFPLITDLLTSQPFFWVNLQLMLHNNLNRVGGEFDIQTIGDWLSNAYTIVLDGMTFTVTFLVNILFAMVMLYFLFRDGDLFFRIMERSMPIPPVYIRRFTERMKGILLAVLRGNVFVSILQGSAISLGLSICHIPNSVLWGAVAAVFSLIPVIGTSVVWLPAALYLGFVDNSPGYALFIVVYGIAIYLFLENIFKPMILDRELGIHPLFLFLAIVGGLKEFGFTGVIIGPLFVAFFMTVWNTYHFWESGGSEESPWNGFQSKTRPASHGAGDDVAESLQEQPEQEE